MTKIAGISLCALICAVLLKDKNKPFSVAVSVGACLIIIGVTGAQIENICDELIAISSNVSSAAPYIKLMLKVLVITLISQFLSDICRDNGENSIAGVTEFAAKIIVISMTLPMISTIAQIINGLIK